MLLLDGDDGEMMKDRREQHTSRLTSYFAIERIEGLDAARDAGRCKWLAPPTERRPVVGDVTASTKDDDGLQSRKAALSSSNQSEARAHGV